MWGSPVIINWCPVLSTCFGKRLNFLMPWGFPFNFITLINICGILGASLEITRKFPSWTFSNFQWQENCTTPNLECTKQATLYCHQSLSAEGDESVVSSVVGGISLRWLARSEESSWCAAAWEILSWLIFTVGVESKEGSGWMVER